MEWKDNKRIGWKENTSTECNEIKEWNGNRIKE